MMSRTEFLKNQGFTCGSKQGVEPWQQSWSFVNTNKRLVAFGAWVPDLSTNHHEKKLEILSTKKESHNSKVRRKFGYTQAIKHIKLIEQEGYKLKIFLQERKTNQSGSSVKIKRFQRKLIDKKLEKNGKDWYAVEEEISIPQEIPEDEKDRYTEGAKKQITVNSYERNRKARDACIEHHGSKCCICDFDFGKYYGEEYKGFIHVHHIKPLSDVKKGYEVKPKQDMMPVCPNCHAVIHYNRDQILTIEKMKEKVNSPNRNNQSCS